MSAHNTPAVPCLRWAYSPFNQFRRPPAPSNPVQRCNTPRRIGHYAGTPGLATHSVKRLKRGTFGSQRVELIEAETNLTDPSPIEALVPPAPVVSLVRPPGSPLREKSEPSPSFQISRSLPSCPMPPLARSRATSVSGASLDVDSIFCRCIFCSVIGFSWSADYRRD